ncbi:MAG: hypothetical protein QOF02_4020 [Blastocatellia bacterium]|jgi:hypothetical protein|nr:hypothetical protein [Blastocatellia bacterium]
MNSLLIILAVALCAAVSVLVPTYGAPAVGLCVVLATATGFIISRVKEDGPFLLRVFIGGLLVRMLIGTLIYFFSAQSFFGGDALTYDLYGSYMLKVMQGEKYYQFYVDLFAGAEGGSGWGMLYYVASIYRLVGQNMLAVQLVNSIMGAATAPIIYLCAKQIFGNQRVSRLAALLVAFFPSLVLWSAQGLKDGPIIFLLSFAMLATLKLGEKLSLKYIVLLVGTLFALLSLRFYIFYMVAAAIAGAFVIGMREATARNFLRQFVVIIFLGLGLTYLGVTRVSNTQLENFANLQAVQRSRSDLATSANSGFGKDVDVSTTSGAIAAIPIGLVYLLFAPFPWQLASLRQIVTLPEMLIWWSVFPMLVLGLWFSVKFKLRRISPILIFTTMLTLAYSVFQGNVGTAYRQRAQILVFYFMFVAVGIVLMKEKREDSKRQQAAARERQRKRPQQRHQQPYVWTDEQREAEASREERQETKA